MTRFRAVRIIGKPAWQSCPPAALAGVSAPVRNIRNPPSMLLEQARGILALGPDKDC